VILHIPCEGASSRRAYRSTAIAESSPRPVIDAVCGGRRFRSISMNAAFVDRGLNFRVVRLPQWVATLEPPRLVFENRPAPEENHSPRPSSHQGFSLASKKPHAYATICGANPAPRSNFEESQSQRLERNRKATVDAYHQSMSSIFDDFIRGEPVYREPRCDARSGNVFRSFILLAFTNGSRVEPG